MSEHLDLHLGNGTLRIHDCAIGDAITVEVHGGTFGLTFEESVQLVMHLQNAWQRLTDTPQDVLDEVIARYQHSNVTEFVELWKDAETPPPPPV